MLAIIISLAVILFSTQAMADFVISEIQPRIDNGKLDVSGTLDLSLSGKVEEAVAKGIPVEVEINFRFKRDRAYWWAEELNTWKVRRQIRYHALSGQYFVNNALSSAIDLENFTSLQQALRHMGTLSEISFDVVSTTRNAPPESGYVLEVRVNLDIETLPAPLRPVAYTSLDWHLNSGWTKWTVKH